MTRQCNRSPDRARNAWLAEAVEDLQGSVEIGCREKIERGEAWPIQDATQ
jgi:hypothetical protein